MFLWNTAALMVRIGLSAPNSETAQIMSFPLLFPLTFASSAFVPLQYLPGWLHGFATYQPVSVVVSACRALMIGGGHLPLGHTGGDLEGGDPYRATPVGRVAVSDPYLIQPAWAPLKAARPRMAPNGREWAEWVHGILPILIIRS